MGNHGPRQRIAAEGQGHAARDQDADRADALPVQLPQRAVIRPVNPIQPVLLAESRLQAGRPVDARQRDGLRRVANQYIGTAEMGALCVEMRMVLGHGGVAPLGGTLGASGALLTAP